MATQKFVARKARKYLAQSDGLLLPALELAYVFHAIAHAPRGVIAHEMIPAVEGALEYLGLSLSSGEGGDTGKEKEKERKKLQARSGYWDDVCLARFLEGVCWRFVAYPVRVHFYVCSVPLGLGSGYPWSVSLVFFIRCLRIPSSWNGMAALFRADDVGERSGLPLS